MFLVNLMASDDAKFWVSQCFIWFCYNGVKLDSLESIEVGDISLKGEIRDSVRELLAVGGSP